MVRIMLTLLVLPVAANLGIWKLVGLSIKKSAVKTSQITTDQGLSSFNVCRGGSVSSKEIVGTNIKNKTQNAAVEKKRKKRKKRILILMSDTGGGHRASAQALAQALERLYPGEFEIDIYDIWTAVGRWPLNHFVACYSYLGRRPWLWRGLWYGTAVWATRVPIRTWHDVQHRWRFKRALLERGDVDCVVSVHPLCQHVPLSSLALVRAEQKRPIPFVTVVTDLGSAHPMWFDARADRVFVPNKRVARLAEFHGVPKKNIIEHGLPLRSDFVGDPRQPGTGSAFLHAKKYDDLNLSPDIKKRNNDITTSISGITNSMVSSSKAALAGLIGWCSIPSAASQRKKRLDELMQGRRQPRVLIVGGGDGFGGLRQIVLATAEALKKRDKPANLVVVCGRNADLRNQLDILLHSEAWKNTKITINILGFVTDMHAHMARADILLTKAGPGTIAEAAALGLPVILTNYLPGQERGNVKFVTSDFCFGQLAKRPRSAARLVVDWFDHPQSLADMSDRAFNAAKPGSTNRIASDIALLARHDAR
mmetsp:Transcript_11915/g.17850  ORF Transcript_11915/g.17850 Transcript_11915/m.17850 type:complete len:536 (-) Transcript_11915:513-2120(-)|eukprot:CAMPEP_0197318036 /NCGR_PEP_ID=MMETSP0891-20130614/49284_1 /TAXON_ID=44058 ORGANISM="Aureoumbra lagunensis, Strain CCMP1510" /NCGR_SAMPLE_ID=MMETSP0891 /ASSEMBLY_ACC=CAM_ASM_000534 /LENGTH=535 /DNA_ID=CAMNT_0042808287 /DNA_START=6 /DNA_END=1613 /DNA_ORIENTATION=-